MPSFKNRHFCFDSFCLKTGTGQSSKTRHEWFVVLFAHNCVTQQLTSRLESCIKHSWEQHRNFGGAKYSVTLPEVEYEYLKIRKWMGMGVKTSVVFTLGIKYWALYFVYWAVVSPFINLGLGITLSQLVAYQSVQVGKEGYSEVI